MSTNSDSAFSLLRIIQFIAILLTAIALVPGGAHLFALPNKIELAQTDYFIVQNIYRGWALFGAVFIPAVIVHAVLAVMLRAQRRPFMLELVALACFALSLAIFFVWTYPANVATVNWTQIPENWAELRRQWEYSHAAGALLILGALAATTLSALLTDAREI